MRLALVVQRYGRDVAGGSEAHCREIAERLAERHQVTVLTSCARDYITWRNEYPSGEERVGPVRVLRFRSRRRRMMRFREVSEIVFSGEGTAAEDEEWFRENGPRVPRLLDHLDRHGAEYDRVLFWTFRYYPSYFGLPRVADRAILLPTAEEDPAIRIRALERFFRLPAGFLFLTPEERELVGGRLDGSMPPSDVIGSGLEPAPEAPSPAVLQELGLGEPFVLYLGRVDPNKGCDTMLRYFMRSVDRSGRQIPLVLAGRAVMEVPEHPLIRPLGFVSETAREALLSHARFLVMPSPYESLSLVLLEAWNHRRPALVNGHCRVLKGQVQRANAGLYYHSVDEFSEAFNLLLDRPRVTDQLGWQGHDYVERHYRWPTVMEKIERALAAWGPPPAEAAG